MSRQRCGKSLHRQGLDMDCAVMRPNAGTAMERACAAGQAGPRHQRSWYGGQEAAQWLSLQHYRAGAPGGCS